MLKYVFTQCGFKFQECNLTHECFCFTSVFGYSYISPMQADLAGFLFDLKRPK